jgi:hypothetical protein
MMDSLRFTYPSLDLPAKSRRGFATLITFISSLSETGKTQYLDELIRNPKFDQALQEKKLRGVILEISFNERSNMLIDISPVERKMILVEVVTLVHAIQSSHKSYAPPLHLITRKFPGGIQNIDVISLSLELWQGSASAMMAHVFILLDIVSALYDFVLVDLPEYFAPIHSDLKTIISRSDYLCIPYPANDPNRIKSLFDLNYYYMFLRSRGIPIKLGGIIPIFAGRNLNVAAEKELNNLAWLVGQASIWPVIPDVNDKNVARFKRTTSNNFEIGVDATINKMSYLITHKPYGMTLDLQNYARKFVDDYIKDQGSQLKNRGEGREKTYKEYGKEMGLIQSNMTAEKMKEVENRVGKIINKISITRHRTRNYCEKLMGITK